MYEPIKNLTDEQLGRLFRCMLLYNLEQPFEVEPDIQIAFTFIRQQMDANNKKYQEVVEKRSKAGKKGGAPKGNKNASKKKKTSKTSIYDNEYGNENDNVYGYDTSESESIAKTKPPSLEEVTNYVRETGIKIDPEHFYNHYESIGWVMGNNRPITNWKAAVQNWEKHSWEFDNYYSDPDYN